MEATQDTNGAADVPAPHKILVVDDITQLRHLFAQGLQSTFGEVAIDHAINLTEARDKLRGNSYDAIITDCGFPLLDEVVREHGNRNGIILIREVRSGQYGKYNARVPIAFNSAELTAEKVEAALSHGGNTKAFKKGSLYGALTVGRATSNFTVGSVAGETCRWLREELTDEKVAERRQNTTEEKAAQTQSSGGTWFSLFRSNSRKAVE